MSNNLTGWKAPHTQRLSSNIKQVGMRMVFVVELWESVYKTDLRNLSLGLFFFCRRHLSWEHHTNNAFTSTSSVRFSEFSGGKKNDNERKNSQKGKYNNKQTWTKNYQYSSAGRFPCGELGKIIFIIICVVWGTQLVLHTPIPKLWGNVCDPHVPMTYWNHTAGLNLVPVTQKLICGAGAAAAS